MITRFIAGLAILLLSLPAQSQYKTSFTVAQDGSGDYTSIQETIDNCKSFPDKKITIHIKNGIYHEKVKIHSWNTNITLVGEDRDSTIIRWNDHAGSGRNSTFTTYTLLVDANDFTAENLTIENSAGEVGQAVAVHVEGDRVIFRNCRMHGNQDTLYAAIEGARQYFNNCYIEGTTDFIFGSATAVFENCEIRSKRNSYVTAASTPENTPFGYVFIDCTLTADEGINSVYLGRPWRSYARTVFLNCRLGGHIRPEGWHNWNSEEKEQTVFYAEYNSSGPGAPADRRVSWSKQLTFEEARQYTLQNIFGNWNPKSE